MSKIQSVKGMNDLLPADSGVWQYVESVVSKCLREYSYREIRFPIVEKTELFKRSIGEVTDIVEKEMYTFEDRNGDSLTLRPEGTAACVRACEQHGLLYNQTQRLWYTGPMFRYERPQKGRLRQFHQVGVETFGMSGPDIDAELLLLSARLWKYLGIDQVVTLQINSIGSLDARASYKAALVEFLSGVKDQLDEDSQRRLDSNPLRILDSKVPATQALLDGAPELIDYLDEESRADFDALKAILDAAGLKYEVNPRLVRGLDYYNKTVFEWVTDELGAQGTVCAGGRYDGLVGYLGGRATPAVGFAMGVERLVLLLETLQVLPDSVEAGQQPHVFVAAMGDVSAYTFSSLEAIRSVCEGLRCQLNCGGGKFKSQLKRANDSGANYALIIGEQEQADKTLIIKDLRSGADQQVVSLEDAIKVFQQFLHK